MDLVDITGDSDEHISLWMGQQVRWALSVECEASRFLNLDPIARKFPQEIVLCMC